MAYSDFTLYKLTREFQLTLDEHENLFADVVAVEIRPFLAELLQENQPLALAIHTEKARSEMLIAPILIELRKLKHHQISLFSGVDFTIAPEQGLNGICDFIITQSAEQLFISAPVLIIFEAKNENIKAGLAQCIAAMFAAQLFNRREQSPVDIIYGAVTTGSLWKFLKLQGTQVMLDQREYHINDIGKILAVLLHIAGDDIRILA